MHQIFELFTESGLLLEVGENKQKESYDLMLLNLYPSDSSGWGYINYICILDAIQLFHGKWRL